MARERNILKMIFTNFINSFRPRQIKGNLKGVDQFGTKYFEIPQSAQTGKAKRSRWFEPADKEDFEKDLPAEWEAWLRGRRLEPPKEEEVLRNASIAEMKKKNALELTKNERLAQGEQPEPVKLKEIESSFPTYKDFENFPGAVKLPGDKGKT